MHLGDSRMSQGCRNAPADLCGRAHHEYLVWCAVLLIAAACIVVGRLDVLEQAVCIIGP